MPMWPKIAFRQAFAEFMPGSAGVGRFEEAAARTAGAEVPRLAAHIPHGRVDDARDPAGPSPFRRIRCCHCGREFCSTSCRRPWFCKHRARCWNSRDGRERRRTPCCRSLDAMTTAAHVLRVRKAHGLPVVAAIARAVNAGAYRHAVAHPGLARSHPNRLRTGRINRYASRSKARAACRRRA